MSVLVGRYARISDDQEDSRLGVGRQLEDTAALCAARRWSDTREYVDNDLSAFKRHVVRPAFEQLLADLESGRIGGVVAYDLDRLFRQPRDLERLIDIYEARPGLVFATVQGDINLGTADGRTMARVMVAFANKSSADTARRVARVHLANARAGKPVGAWRPFGWAADKRALDPGESALVRDAVARILRGGDLASIVREWNAACVKTTRGNDWLTTTLRTYLLSPRLAGWRVHQGEIARDAEGAPVRGQYEALLNDDTWTALCAVLTGEGRAKFAHRGGRTPTALLSGGILRCGRCGAAMRSSPSGGRRYYACPSPTGARRGCGRNSIVAEPVEQFITDVIMTRLRDAHASHDVTPWPLEGALEGVTSRISDLMSAFTAGTLSAAVVFPAVEKLEAEAAELRQERTAWVREEMARSAMPDDVVSEWPNLGVDEKRAVLSRTLRAVVVKPATTRGRFDHARVDLVTHG